MGRASAAARPPQWLLAAAATDLRSHAAGTLRCADSASRLTMTAASSPSGVPRWCDSTECGVRRRGSCRGRTGWCPLALRDANDPRATGEPNIGALVSSRVVGQADGSWTLAVWPDPAPTTRADPARVVLVGMTSAMFLLLWGATYFIHGRSDARPKSRGCRRTLSLPSRMISGRPCRPSGRCRRCSKSDRLPSEQRRREGPLLSCRPKPRASSGWSRRS